MKYYQSSVYFNGTNWYKNVTFTADRPGQYMICASAMDSSNLTSDLYCYSVAVGISDLSIVQSTMSPVGNIIPNGTVYFTSNFTALIKRPSIASNIYLVDSSNNSTVATLSTSDTANVVIIDSKSIKFNFGNVLQLNKNYYIRIDEGKKKLNN